MHVRDTHCHLRTSALRFHQCFPSHQDAWLSAYVKQMRSEPYTYQPACLRLSKNCTFVLVRHILSAWLILMCWSSGLVTSSVIIGIKPRSTSAFLHLTTLLNASLPEYWSNMGQPVISMMIDHGTARDQHDDRSWDSP
jgi:hypothetical protein